MEFKNPLLVVTDLEKSKAFFSETLGAPLGTAGRPLL